MSKLFRSTATLFAVVLGLVGLMLVLYAWRLPPFNSTVQSTDNAYVRGQVAMISPQLAGYIAEVAVQDYQAVKAGQLLVRIDDRIFQQKLEQAKATLASQRAALTNSEQKRRSDEARIKSSEAQVDSAKAALTAAEANWSRIEPLLKRGVTTQSQADESRSTLDRAKAALSQAQAALEVSRQDLASTIVSRQALEAAVQGAEAAVHLSEIDVQNTRILAPEDGRLSEVGARLGQYVGAGTQLLAIVPDRMWIVANFKETQIAAMKVGQPVTFAVDALEHASMTGHIERFSPAAGSEFSVLKADNATGNFTKVAQRLPVRIEIDPGQELAQRLAPGMSVVVDVETAPRASLDIVKATGSIGGASEPSERSAAIATRDLEKTVGWYRDVLGFRQLSQRNSSSGRIVLLDRQGALLEIREDEKHDDTTKVQGTSIAVTLLVSDVDSEVDRLGALGVEIVAEVQDRLDNHFRGAVIRDNQGNLVKLREPLDG